MKTQNLPNNSSKATSMAELMGKTKTSFNTFSKWDNVKGTITKLTPSEILIDINAKAEAIVFEKDKGILRNFLNALHVGDVVDVMILSPESDTGNPVVSLRRFMDDKLWDVIAKKQEKQEQVEVTVLESTKGGLVVETKEKVSGFLPNSQTTFVENPQDLVGKIIPAYVIEINRKDHKVVFSQRRPVTDEAFVAAIKGIKIGEKVKGTVSAITPFGLFVSFTKGDVQLDGLVHISEIAWEHTDDIAGMFSVGQELELAVVRIDRETKRIDLSLKRLTEDPFSVISKRYPADQKVKAKVIKVLNTGVSVVISDTETGEDIEGFIRKEKIPPTVTYTAGQEITATVVEIDSRRHKILLVPVLKEKPIGYR